MLTVAVRYVVTFCHYTIEAALGLRSLTRSHVVTSTHVCMHSCMYVRMCLRSYSPGFLYKSIMAVKKTIVIEGIDFWSNQCAY